MPGKNRVGAFQSFTPWCTLRLTPRKTQLSRWELACPELFLFLTSMLQSFLLGCAKALEDSDLTPQMNGLGKLPPAFQLCFLSYWREEEGVPMPSRSFSSTPIPVEASWALSVFLPLWKVLSVNLSFFQPAVVFIYPWLAFTVDQEKKLRDPGSRNICKNLILPAFLAIKKREDNTKEATYRGQQWIQVLYVPSSWSPRSTIPFFLLELEGQFSPQPLCI